MLIMIEDRDWRLHDEDVFFAIEQMPDKLHAGDDAVDRVFSFAAFGD